MPINYANPRLVLETARVSAGQITWQSPSNLAIIKYWGKYGRQFPRNPSISFTLSQAVTTTALAYAPREGVGGEGVSLKFYFDGQENPAFGQKVQRYLDSLGDIFPFLRQLDLTIESANSFPHSAGIASSASSMSALALCLCSLEDELFGTLADDEAFEQKASFVARLGSGSACRSIFSKMALWGATGEEPNSSDDYAVPMAERMHEVFQDYHDAILIVSQGEKSVSSSAGHELMNQHPYADVRYQHARQQLHHLLAALESGDVERFGNIAENEALALHGLMMSSNPSYLLMAPNSITLINKVRAFRQSEKVPLYFSLDAGPNLHLLYPDAYKGVVQDFIIEQLTPYCEDHLWIADEVGDGPVQL